MSGFFEEIAIGAHAELGSHAFTSDAIRDFARRYDPQRFHLDDEAARAGPFGRLAASGWHTASIWMKLNVLSRTADEEVARACHEPVPIPGPSPGFKNLKWLKPVFVDDTVTFARTVTSKRPTSNPAWGLIFAAGTGHNQHGELVFSLEGCVMVQRRVVVSS